MVSFLYIRKISQVDHTETGDTMSVRQCLLLVHRIIIGMPKTRE